METLVHVIEGFGSPSASQFNLALLSAGNDTVLICGSAILGLDLRTGTLGGAGNEWKGGESGLLLSESGI